MLGPATLALALDLAVGEPPASFHPTVWMGRQIAWERTRRRHRQPAVSFGAGILALIRGSVLTGAGAAVLSAVIARVPPAVERVATGLALKPALSLRALLRAAAAVQRALERGSLGRARRLLGVHLVSRATHDLTHHEVAGAAIESVAENLSDGFVAPLVAYYLGGLPAAYVYRFVNTADAMLGYRTADLEWFGKPAARLDDVLNLIPARLTAGLICCTAWTGRGSSERAVATALRDAHRTDSPNAGWPMAAMAGALGVELTKRGHYRLNRNASQPRPCDINRACRIATVAAVAATALIDIAGRGRHS